MSWLALVLALPAGAFTPDDAQPHGGLEPQLLQVAHPKVQAALSRGGAWQAFLAAEGPGWQVTWDESTRTPRRLRGPGVPLPTHSAQALGQGLLDWLTPHADLLGVDPSTLRIRSANHVERVQTWYIDIEAPVEGLNVWRGGLTARVKHGRLVDLGVASFPGVPVTGAFALTPNGAIRRAIQDGPASAAKHHGARVEPMLLPLEGLAGLELRRVQVVRSQTDDPPGQWVSFVDGATGELLSVHNEVRYLTGQVHAEHDVRGPYQEALTVSPLPLVEVVSAEGASVVTDAQGAFTLPSSEEYAVGLQGEYALVENHDGPNGALFGPGPDFLLSAEDVDQAEVDTYVFLHHARDWGMGAAPEVPMVQGPVQANVNLNQTCNAFFDGQVNFFRAGNGCHNTGRIADVVYHEWGHGFHLWSLQSYWRGFDSSLSEGASDTVSFLMTGDHRIAPGFFTSGHAIRDVDNEARYPEDFVLSDYFSHENGLIFGGAMWDLWNRLVDELGEEAGTAATTAIFSGLLKGGPDIPNAFDEALVADDDNGDLSDGTPHDCAIIEAFGAHGLGPLGAGAAYVATHEPPAVAAPNATLRFDLASISPGCFPYDPEAATLSYRVDGGEWQVVPARIDAAGVEGELPTLPLGSFVEYWLDVEDASGARFTAPSGGYVNPYSFFVGEVLPIWCEDFEDDDGGFKHRLVDGADGEGADDWQWGKPSGIGGDPSSGYSGQKVWGNDLGYEGYNGTYQDGKHNRLRSPEIELDHYADVFLHYRRWLNVEDGVYDRAWIEADGEVVWSNHASSQQIGNEHHLDDEWVPHAVPLGPTAADGRVRLAWHLSSDGGLGFGGWTLDDVCLFAPATPDNRLGISDFEARDIRGVTHLSWTNPVHEPVAEVRVVRSASGWPEGPTDGEVVFEAQDPEPGALVQHVYPVGQGFFAVYASDGEAWLSWTVEGWNAARVGESAADHADGPGASEAQGGAGCGCNSQPVSAGWLALGLAWLGIRRRRGGPIR